MSQTLSKSTTQQTTQKKVSAFAATSPTAPLAPFEITRKQVGANDVELDILYCGICHSDLHLVRDEWGVTQYPIVPGHEIVGRVTHVGNHVKKFKVGDLVAVGCMVGSCGSCSSCHEHLEQYCEAGGPILTFNSIDPDTGNITYGGYSTSIVVNEAFTLKIPSAFQEKDLPGVAPLLCAGVTTYSPLKKWGIKKGSNVAVVGLGGLGHMALKLSKALGAKTTLFTTHENKVQDAKRLGADEVIISKNEEALKKKAHTFDFILDTVSAPHNLDPYLEMLKRDGTLCLLGLPSKPHPSPNVAYLIQGRKHLAGSLIGGVQETQELLDFCAKHHITSDVEIIPIQDINKAYERMLKGDVKYRFVIDINSLK